MEITDVVKVVMEQIKETVRSETVIGKPVQAEEAVIIPVSRVSFGFGAGGGQKGTPSDEGGMGAGGGATVEPVAFVVVSKGKAQILPLKSREATLTRLIDLIPSVLDMMKSVKTGGAAKQKGKKQDSSEETSEKDKK
ncbi:MAG: sporulation protein [Candidatus Latescibacteria bacterium]|nr:sporulation protein [Candidatus Latescibacterota bacterium]